MAHKIISKATIASLMFSALIAPQAIAAEPTTTRFTKPHTETVTTSTLHAAPNHTAKGKVFTDSYDQTGLYTTVTHHNTQKNLTIVLGEESLNHVNTNEDTLYITPPAHSWTDYSTNYR